MEISPEAFLFHARPMIGSSGEKTERKRFKAHFNCSPETASRLWYLLMLYITGYAINPAAPWEMLWALLLLTTNDTEPVLASKAKCSEKTFRERAWMFVSAIADLEGELIDLDNRFIGAAENQVCFLSVDGVDFKVYEQWPTWPSKAAWHSHKFKTAGLRYEIGVCIQTGDCVWLDGPHRCGTNTDGNIFRGSLMGQLKDGEECEGDGHYQAMIPEVFRKKTTDEEKKIANRVRARHEVFNSRIKSFRSMSETFRHGTLKHSDAARARIVISQLKIDCGEDAPFQIHNYE